MHFSTSNSACSQRISLAVMAWFLVLPLAVNAVPPWKAAYLAEIRYQRAILAAQQAAAPLPNRVYQQQKKAQRQEEKYLKRYYRTAGIQAARLAAGSLQQAASAARPAVGPSFTVFSPALPVTASQTNVVPRCMMVIRRPTAAQTATADRMPNSATRIIVSPAIEGHVTKSGSPAIRTGNTQTSKPGLATLNSPPPRSRVVQSAAEAPLPAVEREPTLAPIPVPSVSAAEFYELPVREREALLNSESSPSTLELLPTPAKADDEG